MKKNFITIALLLALLFISCKPGDYADLGEGIFADIQTNYGSMIVKLYYEKAPVTVANFVSLAEGTNPFVADSLLRGKKYYDGLIFHRVIKDFMIQGGDPAGTGSGTPGYRFKDEFHNDLTHDKKGMLSMANSGPKTNGSQFFITHKETPWLDGKHTVFGEVVKGMEVVDAIANVETGAGDKPKAEVVMKQVIIIRKGEAANTFDAVKIMTDYFAGEEVAEEKVNQLKASWMEEVRKQKKEAQTKASGLKIYTLVKGRGEKPKSGQKVLVHYTGWLSNGTLFHTSEEAVAERFNTLDLQRRQSGGYAPFAMEYSPKSPLIPGFKEGLQTMRVGDKVRLFIPPHLGYGAQGKGPIPPDTDLIFDVEIVEIQK